MDAAKAVTSREPAFSGERVRIGRFAARPEDPGFRDSGPARGYLVVFPRTAVRIAHAGHSPVVADPTRIVFYNLHQEYTRARVAPEGDRCDWFAFSAEDVIDAVGVFDPRAADRPARPFARTWGPGDPRTYALQRALFDHVTRSRDVDRLLVEETAMRVLHRAVAAAYRAAASRREERPLPRAHAELAAAIEEHVTTHFAEPLALADVARAVGRSTFHVARVFRRATGRTIHSYKDALRLHRALDEIPDRRGDLIGLALDLGYASHSHFTSAFRRTFGVTPTAFAQSRGRLGRARS